MIGESGGKSDEQRRQNARTYVPLDLDRDSMVSTVYRAVPSTRVARVYSSFFQKSSSFIFELEYSIIFCKRQTAIKTGKPLAQTFVTQLRDKFSLAWDDANQFRDCPGQLQLLAKLYDAHGA